MKKIIIILSSFILFLLTACSSKIVYKEVLIPTKCDIPERVKPKREAFSDFTEFQTHLRAYYRGIEMDLLFCRTGKKYADKPP